MKHILNIIPSITYNNYIICDYIYIIISNLYIEMRKTSKKIKKKIKRIKKDINIMELISESKIDEIIDNLKKIELDKPIHLDAYLIHYAGYLNNIDLLKAILKIDEKWDYKNVNGFTIAHIASSHGYCEILSL